MSRRIAIVSLAAIPLIAIAGQGAAQETEASHYSQGFEEGADPVRFWLSYDRKYTVNEKVITEERACTGTRSLKLDVTFDETSRFLWHIPMETRVPVDGRLTFSGRLSVGEETTGRATLGVSFAFPPTKHTLDAWEAQLDEVDRDLPSP